MRFSTLLHSDSAQTGASVAGRPLFLLRAAPVLFSLEVKGFLSPSTRLPGAAHTPELSQTLRFIWAFERVWAEITGRRRCRSLKLKL